MKKVLFMLAIFISVMLTSCVCKGNKVSFVGENSQSWPQYDVDEQKFKKD